MKGGELTAENGLEAGLVSFLKEALSKDCFDAVMVPTRVPSGDSFTWILTSDEELLSKSSPLPPIMSVQGARALSSMTRKGASPMRIAAVMRPCEVRAAVELSKLKQVELANVTILSTDCPGVLELSSYVSNPEKGDADFRSVLAEWDGQSVRPVCRSCTHFSQTAADVHIASIGSQDGKLYLIPGSPKGAAMLETMGIAVDSTLDSWEKGVDEIRKKREKERSAAEASLKDTVEGTEKLLSTFSTCIDCRNCMRVCPVCYCRQCFFDSEAVKLEPDNYLSRAGRKGGLRFPPDTLLFHLGRLSHMSLSCVSCGTCEDACPMSIPIAQIFGYVANRTQKVFDYEPGRDYEEPLPLQIFRMDELHDFEQPYVQTYAGKEKADA
ncbi:MAG: hypothetical protein AMJ46_05055 [Latescibacteria bacterium DG_63]|nr:MAG: hypothetical protein AMJ46_05055 [Latescibacteria bacterium DG_63]